MKQLILSFFVAAALLFASMGEAAAQERKAKFGNVNSQQLMELLPEWGAAQKSINSSMQKYEQELAMMGNDLDEKYEAYLTQRDTLPALVQERRVEEISNLQQRITEYQGVAQQEVHRLEECHLTPLAERVMSAIATVGKKNHYTYIFDMASENRPIYCGKSSDDISILVKRELGIE